MTEFATFSDLLKTAEHGTSSLYYPQLLRCGRVRVTKDRLESRGEQMYRLDWESVERMGRDLKAVLSVRIVRWCLITQWLKWVRVG